MPVMMTTKTMATAMMCFACTVFSAECMTHATSPHDSAVNGMNVDTNNRASEPTAEPWVALRCGEGGCLDTSCGDAGGVCDRIDLWDCVSDGHNERFRVDPPGSAADCLKGCVRIGPGDVGPNPDRVSLAGWCVEALLPSQSLENQRRDGTNGECPDCPSSTQVPCNGSSLAQQMTLTGSGALVSTIRSNDGRPLCVSVSVDNCHFVSVL